MQRSWRSLAQCSFRLLSMKGILGWCQNRRRFCRPDFSSAQNDKQVTDDVISPILYKFSQFPATSLYDLTTLGSFQGSIHIKERGYHSATFLVHHIFLKRRSFCAGSIMFYPFRLWREYHLTCQDYDEQYCRANNLNLMSFVPQAGSIMSVCTSRLILVILNFLCVVLVGKRARETWWQTRKLSLQCSLLWSQFSFRWQQILLYQAANGTAGDCTLKIWGYIYSQSTQMKCWHVAFALKMTRYFLRLWNDMFHKVIATTHAHKCVVRSNCETDRGKNPPDRSTRFFCAFVVSCKENSRTNRICLKGICSFSSSSRK